MFQKLENYQKCKKDTKYGESGVLIMAGQAVISNAWE